MPASLFFRSNLRSVLSSEGISQRELAARAKTSVSYINRVLMGEIEPTMDRAEELAQCVGLSLADLLVDPKKFFSASA